MANQAAKQEHAPIAGNTPNSATQTPVLQTAQTKQPANQAASKQAAHQAVSALKQPSKGMLSAARVIGVVTTGLSIFSILLYGSLVVMNVSILVDAFTNPETIQSLAEASSDFAATLTTLGLGTEFTPTQTAWLSLVAFTAAIVCGFVFSIMMLCSSIALIKLPKHPEKGYRTCVLAALGAVMAVVSGRFISAFLLIVAAILANRIYIVCTGEDAEYANAKHLGAMRLVEIACVLTLVSNAIILVFVTQTSTYDASYWVSFIQLILMAVTLWVLVTRKQYGCKIIVASVVAYLVLDLAVQLATGRFQPAAYVASIVLPVLMLVYFSTSKRAKATLVQPFRKESRQQMLAEEEKLWNLKSPAFWRNLVLYFCIFSVVGHWMEYAVCWLIRLGWVPGTYDPNSGIWRDMLNPFFVYGTAFVFIGLALYPFKLFVQKKTNNTLVALLVSFLANTLFCAIIELLMGFAVNDHLQLWDYSTMAFNFMGQICLLNTSFFGIMATLMTWLVYPNLEKAFARIPRDVVSIITVVVVVFFVLVVCMYVVNVALPGNLNATMAGMITTN